MKKVSVIIPMYQSEKFIRQCLNSLLAQTFQDMEIIVVNDGSTDRGTEICEELGRTDDRIRLYCQENKGVSAARNYGIEIAEGEYVFFLDSDDVIHPFLVESMVRQAEEQQADLVFCGYRKLEARELDAMLNMAWTVRPDAAMDAVSSSAESDAASAAEVPEAAWAAETSAAGRRPDLRIRFETAEGKEAEKWFHIQYVNVLSGIGGKLLRRAAIGSLRFDRGLKNGEDTLFLYYFIRKQVRAACLQKDWYYYRIHPESATQSSAMLKGKRYFESSRRIRDEEYKRGQTDFSLTWERFWVVQIERIYTLLRNSGNQAGLGKLRKLAAKERRHPMFRRLVLSEKLLYDLFWFWHVYLLHPA